MEKQKRISFDASNKSKQLFDFHGKVEEELKKEEEIVVKVKGVEKTGMSHVAIAITAFEKYWGTTPEKIVLTKEEEARWKKIKG
jgi:ribosomal protein L6P/L9E